MGEVIDLFAGPGGWDLAARALGLDPFGIEWDDAACSTRDAAGLRTLMADVAAVDPADYGKLDGLIASPPCTAFSMAGAGEGRDAVHVYVEAITRWWAQGEAPDYAQLDEACGDPSAHLVLEPMRWAWATDPEWIALEQVPSVLPVWEAIGTALTTRDYYVWTGLLSAEQYGVPQTRTRAILLARKKRYGPVSAPPATHQRYVAPRVKEKQEESLFDVPEPERIVLPEDEGLLPWVSMAQALGWDEHDRVGFRATNDRPNAATRDVDEPAPTLAFGHNPPRWLTGKSGMQCDARIAPAGHHDTHMEGSVRVTVAEAAVLQSFPADYPWNGLAVPQHVAARWAVVRDGAVADELPSEIKQRTVSFTVRVGGREDGQVLSAVVVADSVDVMNDLARLRVGDLAVLRCGRAAGEDDVAVAVLPGAGGDGSGAALVSVLGITVEPPLLPVAGAERACDGGAFAVEATWLGWAPGESVGAVPVPLVVHETHAARSVGALATFDLAEAHVSSVRKWVERKRNTRTKQFQAVGNAVPPLLAWAVLKAVVPGV